MATYPMRFYGTTVAVLVAGLAASGCERARVDEPGPQMIRVEGCLTAAENQLVLTQLRETAPARSDDAPAAGEDALRTAPPDRLPPPQATQMYQLVGAEDELRPHVGRQVRIVGEADPPDVAIVRKTTPADPRGAPADDVTDPDEVDPQVSTMQKLRLEATELRVRTVTPLDRPCLQER